MLPRAGETAHVAPVLAAPVTDAVNCWVWETPTVVLVGLTFMETVGTEAVLRVTVALAEALGLPAVAAVIVTILSAEMLGGAVYKPEFEIVPTLEFPPRTPFTVQETSELLRVE